MVALQYMWLVKLAIFSKFVISKFTCCDWSILVVGTVPSLPFQYTLELAHWVVLYALLLGC